MRVTCPHCAHVGELDTSQLTINDNKYTCSKCRARVPVDVRDSGAPKSPSSSEETPEEGVPWEVRQNGIFSDFVKSIQMILKKTGEFFELISLEGNFQKPLLFGLIMSVIIGLLFVFWKVVLSLSALSAYDLGWFFESLTTNEMIFYSIVILVGSLLESLLGSLFYHFCLIIAGSGNSGFGATVRVRLYSMACGIFLAIPVIGIHIWGFAGLIVTVIGLSQVHNSSIGRVIMAIIWPFVALNIPFLLSLLF